MSVQADQRREQRTAVSDTDQQGAQLKCTRTTGARGRRGLRGPLDAREVQLAQLVDQVLQLLLGVFTRYAR
ncbi:hypothetical protein [Kitasatospora sp. NPDC047058]|uniref:hypothetical protein n=1 Tax=Kitasatospora sp. NPDC047058 TaxID=3155620 RepID=UPI0033F78EEE